MELKFAAGNKTHASGERIKPVIWPQAVAKLEACFASIRGTPSPELEPFREET
jgi:hypothetical protein